MSGRGDNNKKGSAGRGASNQSNQGFITSDEKHGKSGHAKKVSGGSPSKPSPRTADQDASRNQALKDSKRRER